MSEIDDIFHDFASTFAGTFDASRPICFPKELNRRELDLSLNSLREVDRYLMFLHRNKHRLDSNELHSTVLYGGAYVGEVIRYETQKYFKWIDYNDYMPQHPELKTFIPERWTPTCAFLVDNKGSMSMPLNKIARFIEDGEADSVHFFAECDIAKARNT